MLQKKCFVLLTCCIFQVVVVNTFSTISASLAQLRRDESLEKFLKLPEKWSVNKAIKNEYQQHIKTLSIDHPLCLGVTRKQRTSELIHAAEIGNVTRLEVLLLAGVDVDAVDLYRVSSLHYSRMHGHLEAERMLLEWGASDMESLPTTQLNDTAVQLQHQFEQDENNIPIVTTIPFNVCNEIGVSGSSFYIDNAFCDDFINKLVDIHDSLSKDENYQHIHQPQSTNAARRSHYCDTKDWVCRSLANALQYNLHLHEQQSPQPHHVFPHFRFISYIGESAKTSFLKPHKDFSVLDRSSGRMSKYTFILYLTTVADGGETVLLDHLPSMKDGLNHTDLSIRYAAKPVKGRLFVFPHGCPHAGMPVEDGDKLILRGDMC